MVTCAQDVIYTMLDVSVTPPVGEDGVCGEHLLFDPMKCNQGAGSADLRLYLFVFLRETAILLSERFSLFTCFASECVREMSCAFTSPNTSSTSADD